MHFLAQGFENQTLLNSSNTAVFCPVAANSGSLFISKTGVKFPHKCISCRLWLLCEYLLNYRIGFLRTCLSEFTTGNTCQMNPKRVGLNCYLKYYVSLNCAMIKLRDLIASGISQTLVIIIKLHRR